VPHTFLEALLLQLIARFITERYKSNNHTSHMSAFSFCCCVSPSSGSVTVSLPLQVLLLSLPLQVLLLSLRLQVLLLCLSVFSFCCCVSPSSGSVAVSLRLQVLLLCLSLFRFCCCVSASSDSVAVSLLSAFHHYFMPSLVHLYCCCRKICFEKLVTTELHALTPQNSVVLICTFVRN
jgi:hypothetical protein